MARGKEHSTAISPRNKRESASGVFVKGAPSAGEGPGLKTMKLDLHGAMRRFDAVFEHGPLAGIEWSPGDLRITRWSAGAHRLFGWTADEALGKRADELGLTHPEDREGADQALRELFSGNRTETVTRHRNLRRDGRVVHCRWHSSAISDAGGHATAIVSLVLDETEQKVACDALEDKEARYAELIENIPAGFKVIDRQWRYKYVSERAAKLMGKPAAELLGRSVWEVFPADAQSAFRADCERAWAEQTTVEGEHYSASLGRWFETVLYPSKDELWMLGRDITERKRADEALRASELRLRTVLDNTPEGYAIYDADRRFEYLNPVGLKLGARELADVVGKRDDEIWPDEFTQGYLPHLLRAYETGSPQTFELSTTAISGVVISMLMTYLPIKDESGAVRQVLAATYDRTERKRFEEALLGADRRKNDFLALLSHELRNPLTPIRYSLFILERSAPTSDQAHRAKAIIARQVDHLARIVDDLLDVTRIARGKIQLQRSPVELGELVRRTLEDYASVFAGNEIALEIELAEKPLVVNGDSARLVQVVGNLLQNAAKFTSKGGRVSFVLEEDRQDGSALLQIRDNGIGIDPDALSRIFHPFEQADHSLDRSSGGLGLGLALVKTLVEMHGGDVDARSDGPGTGAEFTVRLPLESANAASVKRGQLTLTGLSRRVLIIEDNVDCARSLGEVLLLGKHEVEIAYTGAEGLDKARRFRPDVVLCDIGLPGMDGYCVAKAFRSDQQLRSAYLVALTGYALPDDRGKARAAGFDQHLAKPPALRKLREVLANAPVRN